MKDIISFIIVFLFLSAAASRANGLPGQGRPWPDTRDGIYMFADQLPSGLTEAQRQFAATHLAGTQKQRLSEIQALRLYNPNFLCLHYQLALGAGAQPFIVGDAWASDWDYVNGQTNWFLYNAASQRVHQTRWHWDVMDITYDATGQPNTGFPQYWMSQSLARMAAAESDGVFADSYTVDGYFGVLNPSHRWFTDITECVANWIPSLDAYGAGVREAFDRDTNGYKLIPNLGGLITGWDNTDYGAGHGGMIEGFCFYPDGYFDRGDWELQMERTLALARRNKILLCQTTPPTPSYQNRMFATASYLLVKGTQTYLNLLITDSVTLEYYPEYDIDLGSYLGEIPAALSNLWNAGWGVYRRDYAQGLVLVNPDSTAASIADLGTNFYLVAAAGGGRIADDGAYNGSLSYRVVNSLTLPGYSGAVLLNTGTNDVTAPDNVTGFAAVVTNGVVQLTWNNPTNSDWRGTVVQRLLSGFPGLATTGTRVYNGTGDRYTDTNVLGGLTYYYTAFAYDNADPANWSVAAAAAEDSVLVPATLGSTRVLQDGAGDNPLYGGCADTFLANFQDPFQNVGAMAPLLLYREPDGNHYRILLRFDLSDIPEGADVLAALLEIYQFEAGADSLPLGVELRPLTRSWVEGTGTYQFQSDHLGASWEEAASGVPWATPGGDYDTGTDFGFPDRGLVARSTLPAAARTWVAWDVTRAVDAWVKGDLPNYGLIFIPTTGEWMEHVFLSAEYGDDPNLRPRLTVTYSGGGGPDDRPPDPVSGLQALPNGTQAHLSWTNPPNADWEGTIIRWRTDRYPADGTDGTQLYDGKNSVVVHSGLDVGVTYYYGAFAYDEVPNYSSSDAGSQATAVGGQDTVPPAPVTGFRAVGSSSNIVLSWINPGDSDFAGTRVVRQPGIYPAVPESGVLIYAGPSTNFTDTSIEAGVAYYYAAFAFDRNTNFALADSGGRDWAIVSAASDSQAGALTALHRSGQTFLTWHEVMVVTGESYRIYRHTQPIQAANLGEARLLATVNEGSSLYRTETDRAGREIYYAIEDLGHPLLPIQGLFVHTVKDSGAFYYAVTAVTNGQENRGEFETRNTLAAGVAETVAEPRPVLMRETNPGRGRTYTQFMDYQTWNPTFDGYAYNYHVTVPAIYTNNVPWPIYLHIEGYGSRYGEYITGGEDPSYGWPAIQIWGDDPRQSWYYGYSGTWDYTQPGNPTTGPIVNFTEERLLRAVYDVLRDPLYNVDTNRIYAYGQSMGGSGALALGMRYPNVFAAVHAGQPMTDYRAATNWWASDLVPRWGTIAANLPIENRGRYAAHLVKYNGLGVYDWMDHVDQMTNRMSDEMAYLSFSHGATDDVLIWPSQGQALPGALYAGRHGFNSLVANTGHGWMGFMDTANWTFEEFTFRKDRSFPAFSWANGSGPIPAVATNFYNLTLEWSCPWNDFAGDNLDTPLFYELAVRSMDEAQTVDITPRRLQAFPQVPGTRVHWRNIPLGQTNAIQSGTVTADEYGLITVTNFQVSTTGNRLRLDREGEIDSDGDTMPDYWERLHGLNPNDRSDGGTTDSDGDGAPNTDEFGAGTNPREAQSVLRIILFNGTRIEWSSIPGLQYRLQSATTLETWTVVGEAITATAQTTSWTPPPPANRVEFYRIQVGNR